MIDKITDTTVAQSVGPEPHDLLYTMETWKDDRPHAHTQQFGLITPVSDNDYI